MDPYDLAIGLIWVGFCGFAAASYATTFIYRLPRRESAFTTAPFCDHCRTPLEPRDLFTLVSWLINRGKCRHCGVPVTALYFISELAVILLFLASFLVYGLTYAQAFSAFCGTWAVVWLAILSAHRYSDWRALALATLFGGLWLLAA